MAKEITKVMKAAKELGYEVYKVTRKNHIMFQHVETGELVTIAGTPSDHHSFKNALAKLRAGAKAK